ncbi:MAG TPA: V-type ATPase subunit [Thermoplasmata archaeon]|nr:V-type ATPase subunit [Thermoplasmata archaeon]
MSGSPYASALGRLKARLPEFLGAEVYHRLAIAKDLAEIVKTLETTPYGPELVRAAATHRGAALLQVGINRTFVARNRLAFESASFAGRSVIGAYLQRWDIENISIILSGRVLNRPVVEAEERLVSWRELPAGIPAGSMTLDDLRALLAQPTFEAMVSFLVRFGYGPVLLPLSESFARTHDFFALLQALDRHYYARLLGDLRFFQGDEWVVRAFLEAEIDERNLGVLLKGKDAGLPVDEVVGRWIDGGAFKSASVPEIYAVSGLAEMVPTLAARFPTLPEGLPAYRDSRRLSDFEAAVRRDRIVREVRRMRAYPLSLAILMTYLLRAEVERSDLVRIVYGKLHGVADEPTESRLVSPRL